MKEEARKLVEALMCFFGCQDISQLQRAVQIFPTVRNFSVGKEIEEVVRIAGLEGWDEAVETPPSDVDMVPENLWWVHWMFRERWTGRCPDSVLELRTHEACMTAWDDVNKAGVTFMAACTGWVDNCSLAGYPGHRLDSWRFAPSTARQ